MSENDQEEPNKQRSQICYLKLATGDEVIGECLGETITEDGENKSYVVIKSPMLMSEIANPYTQSTQVALSKYIPLGEYEVLPVERKDIIFILPVVKEMEDFYTSSVVYTRQFVGQHIKEELKRSTKA